MPDNDQIFSDEDIVAIRTSPEMQSALLELATDIASSASDKADAAVVGRGKAHREKAEYGTDLTVGTDRARAHVWAKNAAAKHAERKVAPLMSIVANDGAGGTGDGSASISVGEVGGA